jgi:hypothetical protein
MRETNKLKKAIEEWIHNNGACAIDIKQENIRLYNGGLFQDCDEQCAELWIGDLDDTIRYLRRLKSFLNKNGFNTRRSVHDYLLDKSDANCTKDEKNPAHFCDCGKYLGHRGFCSEKCHNEHYDANCAEDIE